MNFEESREKTSRGFDGYGNNIRMLGDADVYSLLTISILEIHLANLPGERRLNILIHMSLSS